MERPNIKYKPAREHVSSMTKEAIDAYAANSAESLKFSPGGDVVALVNSLGGKIEYKDLFDIDPDESTIWVTYPNSRGNENCSPPC